MSATQIERLITHLHEADVEFIVIGGAAAIAHGSAHVTFDVDICYARTLENIARLCAALAPLNPRLRGTTEDVPFTLDPPTVEAGLNFTLTTDAGDLDLFGEVAGLGRFEDVLASAEIINLFGYDIHVLSLDGLIQSKQATGREKDLRVLPELEALRELNEDAE